MLSLSDHILCFDSVFFTDQLRSSEIRNRSSYWPKNGVHSVSKKTPNILTLLSFSCTGLNLMKVLLLLVQQTSLKR